MKKLLIICVMLIASISYSQGTILITPEQAKEAIKNAQRVQVLEVAVRQQGIAIAEFQLQVADLEDQVKASEQQNDLWEKNYNLLHTQFEAEKAKKPKNTVWEKIGIGAGAFLIGFFFASVK
ncbi:hypothetical protein [Salinimicrobium sediminis]|uniref:hypothetical protein n=1 Tax=Salinimicrobium sediminis TaxID=1343891 RepID=UPI0015C88638|nr:hypothetical protein [Salinimicrobium sediminis]